MDEQFPLLPRTRAITLDIILRTVIGVHDEGRLAVLREALPPMLEIGSPLELLPPPRLLRNVGLWRRRKQNKARAHVLLLAEIARCRRDPNLARRADALAMMVRASDDEQPMDDRELATFAQTEMRTVLREVLRRVELAPTTGPSRSRCGT